MTPLQAPGTAQPRKAPRRPYRLANGSAVPSVTTVMSATIAKDSLIQWAANLARQGIDSNTVRDNAAAAGSYAHALIEHELIGSGSATVPDDPEVEASGMAAYHHWRTWSAEHDITPVGIELRLVSEVHGFGGTLDLLAEGDGRLELLDFKTGRIRPEHVIQLSAYRTLVTERTLHRPEAVRVLHLPRSYNATPAERVVESTTAEWRAFRALLKAYGALQEVDVI